MVCSPEPPTRAVATAGSELPGGSTAKGRFSSSAPILQLSSPAANTAAAATANGHAGRRTDAAATAIVSAAGAAGACARRSSRKSGAATSGASAIAAMPAAVAASSGTGEGSDTDSWLVTVMKLMADEYLISEDPMVRGCGSVAT